MVDKLTFPLVIHANPTKLERRLFLLLVAFIFLPFTYGIFTSQGFYCLSLPVGFFGILTYNHFTDYKFTPLKTIQKNKFVCFSENEVKIWEDEEYSSYNWSDLENIELNIIAFKGKWKDEDGRYDGIENYISFDFQNVTQKHLFYIDTPKEFNFLWDYFEKIILPKLYLSKRIKDENIMIKLLDYTELQKFKIKYNINRYTDFVHFN